VVLTLDLGQISFSLVKNAFAIRQLAVLATGIAFKTFWPRHAQKSKGSSRAVTGGTGVDGLIVASLVGLKLRIGLINFQTSLTI